jgi:hypothetical protein
MATTSGAYNFNLEDKICWEELAPSLQDRLKALWDLIHSYEEYFNALNGDVRVTIGPTSPSHPINFAELWFDTNFMICRAYVNNEWTLTRAMWYNPSATSVTSTVDAKLSSNPRTNCHCYTVVFPDSGYCHCKVQLWDSSTVAVGTTSNIAFNKYISTSYFDTTQYRFIISGSGVLQTLNTSVSSDNVNAIVPSNSTDRILNTSTGEYEYYCSYDSKYDAIFDSTTDTSYTFSGNTVVIPIKYAENVHFDKVFGRLSPTSNGPLTITLQAFNYSNYINIFTVTLQGN